MCMFWIVSMIVSFIFQNASQQQETKSLSQGDDSDTDDDDIKVIIFKRCYLNYFKEEEVKMIKTDWDSSTVSLRESHV